MPKKREDWREEVVEHWQNYSTWDRFNKRWVANVRKIIATLDCSMGTARVLAAKLDLVVLPDQPGPEDPRLYEQKLPDSSRTYIQTNDNMNQKS